MLSRLTSVLIAFTFFVGFVPTVSAQEGWTGNINFFLGQKHLDDDWEPVEDQGEFGVEIDFRQESWPISIAIDIMGSQGEESEFGIDFEGKTSELNLGVKKVWDQFHVIRPFIGGGMSFITAEFEGEIFGFSVSDDDTGTGFWFCGGVYWTLAEHFNLGLEYKYSEAEVTLFDTDVEAGGEHFGLLLGYHW